MSPKLSFFFEAKSWLKYCMRASGRGGHGVHSPLMYELITEVLPSSFSSPIPVWASIEAQRKQLKQDTTTIEIEDFGAGSRINSHAKRSIASIAHHALQPKRSALALARWVKYYKPVNILELGTSLGITTAYLASAHPQARVWTLEGASAIAQRARNVWQALNIHSIQCVGGNMDETLRPVLNTMKRVDFVLMDGNHRYQPTLDYFHQLLPHLHSDSLVVLDDIHWSEEMQCAWRDIIAMPQVTTSVDFFHFGLLYFKAGRTKEHFTFWLPR